MLLGLPVPSRSPARGGVLTVTGGAARACAVCAVHVRYNMTPSVRTVECCMYMGSVYAVKAKA